MIYFTKEGKVGDRVKAMLCGKDTITLHEGLVKIEAFLWTGGEDQIEDPLWIIEALKNGSVRFENQGTNDVALLIDTLEGTRKANSGDYIIKGIHGELYPCKPDIFKRTHYTEEDIDSRENETCPIVEMNYYLKDER